MSEQTYNFDTWYEMFELELRTKQFTDTPDKARASALYRDGNTPEYAAEIYLEEVEQTDNPPEEKQKIFSMSPKDKKIIDDAINKNIPIFVLTAKDSEATRSIIDYLHYCINAGCDPKHLTAISHRLSEFLEFQEMFPHLVKKPD